MSATADIEKAIDQLQAARVTLHRLQKIADACRDAGDLAITPHELWLQLEAVDDRVFDALHHLGD